jgi:hypothetical protein
MVQYIYTKKLNVSVQTLAIIDNVGLICYYFFFLWLINKLKGVPLWKLFILGNLSGLVNVFQMSVFFDLPMWVQLSSRFISGLFLQMSGDFFILPLIGRISKYLPEGFESTGVVVIIASLNFSGTESAQLGASQQIGFGIHDGYYDRGLPLFVLDYAIQVGLAVVAPLFLAWG